MKKLLKNSLLSLGGVSAIVAPVASTISCGNNKIYHYRLLPTYAGQADQLIALGIKADYYPLQLDQKVPFGYLTNPAGFISKNHDQTWINKFADKVKSLVPNVKGTGWWNQQALSDGEKGSDPEYWTHRQGDLVLYEHYLLDDGVKAIDVATAPKHTDLPSTFIQTNFRQSRDPFTRMTQNIILGLLDKDVYDGTNPTNKCTPEEKNFIDEMLTAARLVEGTNSAEKAVNGTDAPSGSPKNIEAGDENSWLYNDYNFAKSYHLQFLDNDQFKQSEFHDIVLDSTKSYIFDKDPANNAALAKVFYESTYVPQEKDLKGIMTGTGTTNPQVNPNPTPALSHHPIYDQQTEIGASPMFEGAMRDNSLYFYDLASKLQNASTNKINDQVGFDKLNQAFHKDAAGQAQWDKMTTALDNANQIEKDLKARYAAIKILVDKLDPDKKTFGLVTIAPGAGVSTLQSSSKYSFIYRELGFNQPLPKSELSKLVPANGGTGAGTSTAKGDTLFNMDDNGWWWNISHQDANAASDGIDSSKTQYFDKFDYGVLAANNIQYDALKDDDKKALSSLWKDNNYSKHHVDYNLWNEGLKTPFVIHMMLDNIVDLISDDAKKKGATDDQIKTAYKWGKYFTTDYIA